MSSTTIINVSVIGGKAIDNPVSKRVTTRNGETTSVTTFVLKTYAGPKEPSMRIEIEAWSHLAGVMQRVTKGRRVIVTGAILQSSWTDNNDKTHYKTYIRASQISLLDTVEETDQQVT
jgi:single-stranded DNA-binding protein